MTISEASQLVIQAGALAKGGDVFVLNMGEPVKIIDLAKKMVELSGLTVRDEESGRGDIEIRITGLRPGEKLFEELLIGDATDATAHPKILRATEEFLSWPELQNILAILEAAIASNNVDGIRSIVEEFVGGYTPTSGIVDWIYLEQELEAQKV